jgi:hypothetical protein
VNPQQLGSLPIYVAIDSGKVACQRTHNFPVIVDQPETGVQAFITVDDILIGSNTEINYNEWYDYESMPELKAYLVALKLISSTTE